MFDFAIMSTSVDFTISTATRRVDVALQWEAALVIEGRMRGGGEGVEKRWWGVTRRGYATLHVTAFKADACKSSCNLFDSFDRRDFFHRRGMGTREGWGGRRWQEVAGGGRKVARKPPPLQHM